MISLKFPWNKFFKFNSHFGLALIFIFGTIRFWIVLWGIAHNRNNFVLLLFLIMWTIPWILLNRKGRIKFGIIKPSNSFFLLKSFLIGLFASVIVFYLGFYLYGKSYNNWFVYMAIPFKKINSIQFSVKLAGFMVSSLIGITLSPVGEEFLYRGLIHEAFSMKIGDKKASIIDSLAFAVSHLAHFGILFLNNLWTFVFVPGLLWVLLMFALCQLFSYMKRKQGSIWAAVCCHSRFNMGMIYYIFFHIL